MNIRKIICYLRRSRQDLEREKRTGEDTLATQRKIMLEALSKLEIPYDMAEEIGSGDKIEDRPVFKKVLENLKADKYGAIAVKEIPRLGRGTYTDMGQIYDLIIQNNIYIVTPYKTYDPANTADLRQIRFELFLAREEFEMIKERLVGAKYNLASEGRWVVGPAPFGYQLNSKTSKLEVYEEEAEIVRLIFTLYVYGLKEDGIKKDISFRAISTYLTRMGIATPRKAKIWRYITVKRIIENPVYIGTVQYRTKKRIKNKYYKRPESEWIVVEDAHEPIIDKETWELSQRKVTNINKQPHVKLNFSPCELAGFVVCGKCCHTMVRQYSVQQYEKHDGSVSNYHKEFLWCTSPGCTFVKYSDVEDGILEYLSTLGSFDAKELEQLFKHVYEDQRQSQQETAAVAATEAMTAKKRAELKRRLDFICEKFEAGVYNDELFLLRKQEIIKEIDMLETISKPAENSKGQQENHEVMLSLKENINTFLEAYRQSGDKTAKNKLLREIIDVVVVTKTGKGKFDIAIHPNFTDK